jgi:hypothetical protein
MGLSTGLSNRQGALRGVRANAGTPDIAGAEVTARASCSAA